MRDPWCVFHGDIMVIPVKILGYDYYESTSPSGLGTMISGGPFSFGGPGTV